jgi:hypothetical protein
MQSDPAGPGAFHGWMESFRRREFGMKDLARIHPARRVSRWRAPFGGQSIHWINCLSASPSAGLPDAPHRDRAAFLADRRAIGETDLFPSSHERR